MALIIFPDTAAQKITNQELMWHHLGQVSHRGLYDGRQQVLTRAPGFLMGRTTVAPSAWSDNERLASSMESFIAALHGSANTTNMPLQSRRIATRAALPTVITVASSAIDPVAGDVLVTLQDASNNALLSTATLRAGGYVNIGTRCYMITGDLSDSVLRCYPGVQPDDGATINYAAPYVHCRMSLGDEGSTPMMGDGDSWGPWTLEFEEAF